MNVLGTLILHSHSLQQDPKKKYHPATAFALFCFIEDVHTNLEKLVVVVVAVVVVDLKSSIYQKR